MPKLKLTGPNSIPVQKVQENRVKRGNERDHTPKTSRPAESRKLKNSDRNVEDNPLSEFCNEGEGNDATFFNLKCTSNNEPVKTVTNNSLVTLTEAINFFCELIGCGDYNRESNDQFASLSALGRNHLLVGSIFGQPIKALIDTGAQASVIGVEFLFKLIKEGKVTLKDLHYNADSGVTIHSATGHKLRDFGEVVIDFVRRVGRSAKLKLIVAELNDDIPVILGPAALNQLSFALYDKDTKKVGEFQCMSENKALIHNVKVNKSQGVPAQAFAMVECTVHNIWNRTIGLVKAKKILS